MIEEIPLTRLNEELFLLRRKHMQNFSSCDTVCECRPCWQRTSEACVSVVPRWSRTVCALLWEHWRRPLGLARFSLSLEQILFCPGLPTSYWWVHNGCCVSPLSSSAFSKGTCWIGEFLWGMEGWSFVLRHACTTFPFLKWGRAQFKSTFFFLSKRRKLCNWGAIWLINESKVFICLPWCFDL